MPRFAQFLREFVILSLILNYFEIVTLLTWDLFLQVRRMQRQWASASSGSLLYSSGSSPMMISKFFGRLVLTLWPFVCFVESPLCCHRWETIYLLCHTCKIVDWIEIDLAKFTLTTQNFSMCSSHRCRRSIEACKDSNENNNSHY